jgi:hypothetical protein
MDIFANPVALAGVVSCAVLAGWAVGRWHGFIAAAIYEANPPASHHQPAFAHGAPSGGEPAGTYGATMGTHPLDNAIALNELHAEITAFRHREMVLASLDSDPVLTDRQAAAATGVHDRVISPRLPHRAWPGCAITINRAKQTPPEATPPKRLQPSPGWSSLTRV